MIIVIKEHFMNHHQLHKSGFLNLEVVPTFRKYCQYFLIIFKHVTILSYYCILLLHRLAHIKISL